MATPKSAATNIEQEVAILDRVLHRLVVTDDDKLSPVLDKLLPKLLRKLNEDPTIRRNVIDVLSHVSKRARPNSTITLPCSELLAICREAQPASFSFNFSLTFLEMGVPRLPTAEQGVVAAEIARGISRLPPFSPSQNILLNLLLIVLENLPLRSDNGSAERDGADMAIAGSPSVGVELAPEDSAVVKTWFLDVCLYPGILTREGSAYHGLSPAGIARLTMREKTWPPELLTRRKLAVVRALKSDLFSPAMTVTPALAAACSTHHEVVKAAEDLLKSLSSSDRTGALQRDAAVASEVLNLVLGGNQATSKQQPGRLTQKEAGGSSAGIAVVSSARSPASSLLAVRALAWLEAECSEGTAARVAEAVRVLFLALFAGRGRGSGSGGSATLPRAPGAVHHDRANEARFRAAGARLAAFIASRCDSAVLPMVGPLLLQAVQRSLILNAAPASGAVGGSVEGASGSGSAVDASSAGDSLLMQIQHSAMLEGCYETVASLAVRHPALFEGDTSVPRLLFSELSTKEPGLRVKISAALGALKGAYRVTSGPNLTSELWTLLWGAASSAEYRARLCAVEWACDLFHFSDVAARRLCISLCDDKVTAVRSAASRGLHPQKPASAVGSAGSTANNAETSPAYPTFAAFVLCALRDDTASAIVRGGGAAPASFKDLGPVAMARALDFALVCRRAHAHAGGADERPPGHSTEENVKGHEAESEEAVDNFVSLIEATLESAPSATDGQHGHAQMVLLHRSAAVALKKLAVGDPQAAGGGRAEEGVARDSGEGRRVDASPPAVGVAEKLATRGPWLQQWLAHESSTEIREAFAEVAGAAAVFMDPDSELVPFLRALGLKLKPCTAAGATGFSNRAVSTAHGAACAVGAILAGLATANASDNNRPGARAWVNLSEDAIPVALSSAAAAIGHPVSLLHVAACAAVGRVGTAVALPLPSSEGGETPTGGSAEERVVTIAAVFKKLWTACKLGETTDASRRAEAAAEALGNSCRGAHIGNIKTGSTAEEEHSTRVRTTLKVLFDMAKNQKEVELQFAVGGAVADVARSGPLFVPSGKVLESMRASARATRREMIEIAIEGTDGEEAGEGGGATVDALNYVLYQVLYVLLDDHSPHISGAAAVYLLAVVQRCVGNPILAAYLTDIQAAFTRKLTVRSEFVQEVAGKGLALVYHAAEPDLKQALVDSLVDALSTGRRRAAGASGGGGGVDVHGGTHAGAALSEAGAGAYGEMCAVANDVGRPDLIYSFLSMASHHAAWTTRRGASYSLGAMIGQVSAGAFGAQLDRIVPRLFRYRFDPSAKTRSAMEQLWQSVVGGGGGGDFSAREKEVIRTNLSAIIKELLRALGERKWRDRLSACAGLADVLRGRGWDQLGPHLEQLWIMADRGLDDIKESVAEAAADFAKTLSNVSVRLCDPYTFLPPHDVNTTNVSSAAAAAARSDAAGQGSDALREEAGEARRTIGTMMEDLRTSEADARARGEDGMPIPEGLASAEGRGAAADDVLRQAMARDQAAAGGAGVATADDAGVGRVLGGGRNVPSAADILKPGRAGTERTGPPPSAAAREAAGAALSATLPWLLRKGILSRCKTSQGLAMRTLQRLVKVCDKDALTPHLAELVATLIEGMSALEPQALQYMQFHAETQLEMTQDQMERLRLSVSRAGPLQDALDQCYRHLDGAGVVEDLMPRLLGLLRSGTGLATRSASAYLVLSLCERAPAETRKAAPKLLPTLTNAALSERSSTLRRTYSSALSTVARLAPAAGVSRLASRLTQLFREADPDFDKRQRRTLALLLGDLCRRAGSQLGAGGNGGTGGGGSIGETNFGASGWAQVLPVAFVARRDPDKPVADAFEEAWQEGLTQLQLGAAGMGEASRVRTAKDAVLLMLPAVLTELSAAISSVSRVTKRQGCSGLKDLASTLGPSLGGTSAGRGLMRRVLSQTHGRTWEGKEELLEAVVALCKAGKGSAISLEPFVWGGPGSGVARAGSVTGGPRGLKRGRSEELLGEAEDETEAEADDEDAVGGEAEHEADNADGGENLSAADGMRTESAAGGVNDDGGGAKPVTQPESSGSNEDDDDDHAEGLETAFLYKDKLGHMGNGEALNTSGSDGTFVVAGAAEPMSRGPQVLSQAASGGGQMPLGEEDDSAVPFGDVVALMLAQLRRKNIKFRRAAAVSLAALLNAFPECCVYEMVAPSLLDYAALVDTTDRNSGGGSGKEDPIMQARAVSCIAAAWPHVPSAQSSASNGEAVCRVQRNHATSLTRALSGAIHRKVWSVRVPILHALAAVVSRSHAPSAGAVVDSDSGVGGSKLAPVITGSLLASIVQAVELCAEDPKYSQVRAAANAIVVAMTSRRELRLALTPHKEGLVAIARAGAEDPEPNVAVEGSKAAQNLAWWP